VAFLEALPVDLLRRILFEEGGDTVLRFEALVRAAPPALRDGFAAKLRKVQGIPGVWKRFVATCFPALGRFREKLPRDMRESGDEDDDMSGVDDNKVDDNTRWRWFAARLLAALDSLHLVVHYEPEGDEAQVFVATKPFASWLDVQMERKEGTPFVTCGQYLSGGSRPNMGYYGSDGKENLSRDRLPYALRFSDSEHVRMMLAVHDKGEKREAPEACAMNDMSADVSFSDGVVFMQTETAPGALVQRLQLSRASRSPRTGQRRRCKRRRVRAYMKHSARAWVRWRPRPRRRARCTNSRCGRPRPGVLRSRTRSQTWRLCCSVVLLAPAWELHWVAPRASWWEALAARALVHCWPTTPQAMTATD